MDNGVDLMAAGGESAGDLKDVHASSSAAGNNLV
jgi:hypothetical protein